MTVLHKIPLIGEFLKDRSQLEKFSPEERKKWAEQYQEHLGFPADASFSAKALTEHMAKRISKLEGFKTTKGIGDDVISEKLKEDTPDNKFVKDEIAKVLTPTGDFDTAATKYKQSVASFKELTKLIPKKYRAQDLLDTMKSYVDEGRKAIELQQKHEVESLKDLFDNTKNPDFVTKISQSLNLKPEDVTKVRDNMVKDLEASHKDQLAAFDKSTSASLTQVHQAAATQREELVYKAMLFNNTDEKTRIEMLRLYAEERKKQGLPAQKTRITTRFTPDDIQLSGIKLEDIKTITSITGSEITQKNGVFSVEMKPMIALNPFTTWKNLSYYEDRKFNVETDMMLIAAGVKASGYKEITMKIEGFESQEVTMERAKQAYEACIKNGFKPEDIDIEVNGKVMKPEDIFKDEPGTLAQLKADSVKIIKALEFEEPTASVPEKIAAMKEESQRLIAEGKVTVPPDEPVAEEQVEAEHEGPQMT